MSRSNQVQFRSAEYYFFFNCVKLYDFIFKIMDFYYFQFNFIKNQNKSEFLMYNLSIIICLLNFQYRVKWKLMACLDMIEKDNYPYSLLYGRLKRKTFVATKIHYLSCFISSIVLFPSSNHLRKSLHRNLLLLNLN